MPGKLQSIYEPNLNEVYHLFYVCQQKRFLSSGNDTIDPYPPIPEEAAKIICVAPNTHEQIKVDFNLFKQFFRKQDVRKPKSNISSTINKPELIIKQHYHHSYEPSNATNLADSTIRRWRRVNEWYREYSHVTEIL
ncbi:MAG: hypothetical protein V2A70_01745 [Candidatus Omnitrophota bacterium]